MMIYCSIILGDEYIAIFTDLFGEFCDFSVISEISFGIYEICLGFVWEFREGNFGLIMVDEVHFIDES